MNRAPGGEFSYVKKMINGSKADSESRAWSQEDQFKIRSENLLSGPKVHSSCGIGNVR